METTPKIQHITFVPESGHVLRVLGCITPTQAPAQLQGAHRALQSFSNPQSWAGSQHGAPEAPSSPQP